NITTAGPTERRIVVTPHSLRPPRRAHPPARPVPRREPVNQGETGRDPPTGTKSTILTGVTKRTAEVRLDGLLRTACDVIVERGLANTRAADVAAAAGVSQALVFYHFATKEQLLARAFSWAAEQDLQRLDALLTSAASPLEKLQKILRSYAAT